jgi:hypothetical protein
MVNNLFATGLTGVFLVLLMISLNVLDWERVALAGGADASIEITFSW